MLTEADGGPPAVAPAPANRHDSMVLQDTLEAVVVDPPNPVTGPTQHPCLGKASDGAPPEAVAAVFGYEAHIRRIGEEEADARGRQTKEARRWVAERTIAWLNKCRGILTRYEKKAENDPGMIQLACALLWYRRKWRLTT